MTDFQIAYVLCLLGVRASERSVNAMRKINDAKAIRHALMCDGREFYGRALTQDEAPGEVRTKWRVRSEAE